MQIVKVQFKNNYSGKFQGIEYSYYAEDENIRVDDEFEVDTKFGKSMAKVTQINVPEDEVITFKNYMKTIPKAKTEPLINEEDVPF